MLVQNEFFDLYLQNDDVLIRLNKEGYPLKSFDLITREYPRLKIHSFSALRNALTKLESVQVIGRWLPLVETVVSANKMTAELIINATINEKNEMKKEIQIEIEKALDVAGISHGRVDLSNELFESGKSVVAAVGSEPLKGADAVIKYLELPDRKPVIREDGSADYYEMNFVYPVEEGDWLGEKIPPQPGIAGIDVFGNPIAAVSGSDAMLRYDRKSVSEQSEEGKVVLRALHGGALEYQDDVICVGKKLTINGDVGPETGTITFDGAVSIYGTVIAGYSVNATGDISIEGMEGVTNAKSIQSSEGSIYIKGGVFGGGETIIEAQGSIFLKHANDCKIYANEVHVGLYLFGSEVVADRIFLDKNRGKIIGGTIKALFSIECAVVGNDHGRVTNLSATGVDVNELQIKIQVLALDLKKRQEVTMKLEEHVSQFTKSEANLSYDQKQAFQKMIETIESNKMKISEINDVIQQLFGEIKNAVPAQIEVSKEAFPDTVIQIGKYQSILHDKTNGVFKLVDGVLNI